MGFFGELLAKLRNKVAIFQSHTAVAASNPGFQAQSPIQQNLIGRALMYGCIYSVSYTNWKHDPNPLIWIQYSDQNITHAINLNYLDNYEKQWLGNMIINIKQNSQTISPMIFYNLLKINRKSIVDKAYRVYKTQMIIQPKLVSAGITYMNKLCLPFNNGFIISLNERLEPSGLPAPDSVSAAEDPKVKERIVQALNQKSIYS